METLEEVQLMDFNVVMGSEAELRQREQHTELLRSMTTEDAKASIMLLNVCNAVERVYAGIETFPMTIDGREATAHLPWYRPYAYTPNDMDELRVVTRFEDNVFGLFVGSTDRLQYGEATVLDNDGGEWTLISHKSLRLRPGNVYNTGLHRTTGDNSNLTSALWMLYAVLEILWLRITLLFESKTPLDELTPHSETNVFDLSLLTREFLELVAFMKASGERVFSAEGEGLTMKGFDVVIAGDVATATVFPDDGMENDVFTAWYCRFLNNQIEHMDVSNVNARFDYETVARLAEISADLSSAERMRRLLVVYQSSGDDEIWRAVQAAIIAEYLKSEQGLKLAAAVQNELPSTGRCYFLAVMDEFEEEIEAVLPGLNVGDVVVDGGERSSTGVMHMANYRYSSLDSKVRLGSISFGPGRGIELSIPQESSLRLKIKGERFRLRVGDEGLTVEEDNLFSKIVRVLNSLPEITILSSGIGRPDMKRPDVSRAWLINLILAGKAGQDKAVWVLRMIYNGLIDVDATSSRASYIPTSFKKEGVGIRIESHLDWRVAQKLCYITDGRNAFLVKDHESRTGLALKRRSPSTIECSEIALSHSERNKAKYNSMALLSRCKLG